MSIFKIGKRDFVFSGSPIFLLILALNFPGADAAEDKTIAIAEKILAYQRANGGWPKNYDYDKPGPPEELGKARSETGKIEDATIDNGATFKEMGFLVRWYRKTKDERYADAVKRGVEYLLEAQYENGGWPQYYPKLDGYFRHITFNDGAMIGAMSLLRDVVNRPEAYPYLEDAVRKRASLAIEKGLDCILQCQVIQDGRPTVWCAQHDEISFEPAKARSYELPSLSGSESVGIVRYLMGIEDPDKKVVDAIEVAVAWFEKSKLEGIRLEPFVDGKGQKDQRVVEDENAPDLWARFYDLETNQPFYCSRDGIPQKNISDISHERRNGYSWLGEYARDLLKKDYPAWRKQISGQ